MTKDGKGRDEKGEKEGEEKWVIKMTKKENGREEKVKGKEAGKELGSSDHVREWKNKGKGRKGKRRDGKGREERALLFTLETPFAPQVAECGQVPRMEVVHGGVRSQVIRFPGCRGLILSRSARHF